MAFDMGFDFRGTAPFVTDPTYGVPVLGEAYPHTYTASNGNSINAGFDSTAHTTPANRTGTNDPRIAGAVFVGNFISFNTNFQVDLSSGSAPGAGTYTVDLAFGDSGAARTHEFKLLDTSTVLIDGTNGGSGIATLTGHFVDATLSDVAATTTWTGATVSKTFATTLAKLGVAYTDLGDNSTYAHFRMTLQAAGASFGSMGLLTLTGVGI